MILTLHKFVCCIPLRNSCWKTFPMDYKMVGRLLCTLQKLNSGSSYVREYCCWQIRKVIGKIHCGLTPYSSLQNYVEWMRRTANSQLWTEKERLPLIKCLLLLDFTLANEEVDQMGLVKHVINSGKAKATRTTHRRLR